MNGTTAAVAARASRNPVDDGRPLVFASYLAPNNLPLYRLITEGVGERLGIETHLGGRNVVHFVDQRRSGCGVSLRDRSYDPIRKMLARVNRAALSLRPTVALKSKPVTLEEK